MKKRIIAIILATLIAFSSSSTAFASTLDEIKVKIEKNKAASQAQTELYDGNIQMDKPFVTPTDFLYNFFDDVIDMYVKEHIYEFTREELIEKFIYDLIEKQPAYFEFMLNTLLGTMDRYSAFHDAGSSYMKEKESTGYGIVVTENDKGVIIEKVIKNSNAEIAGLMSGDRIISVMGYHTERLTWYAISTLLSHPYLFVGAKNESGVYEEINPEIEMVVDRNGQEIKVTLKKGLVQQNELNVVYYEEEKVAYLEITSFIADTLADEFKETLKVAKEKGYNNLIIDLRNNGGGSFDLALKMSENFVNKGEIMCYVGNRYLESPEGVTASGENMGFEKISVLINRNTASAAELMASILRIKSGAVLVGERSFGKALGQTVYGLSTNDSIAISTYEVFDANGESYDEIGLIPDLVVENVEMLYELPKLEYFNHVNYKEIVPGVYSEPCLALEKRLEIIGLLRHASVDGIWDEDTALSIKILQRAELHEDFYTDGTLNDKTVTLITNIINSYKGYTYDDDSQLDTALIYHSSFSQAKRLVAEREKLAKQQKELIKQHEEMQEALLD